MKRAIVVALATGAVISSAAALGIGAAGTTPDTPTLTRAQYEGELRALEERRDALAVACEAFAGNLRDVCRAEAFAAATVGAAEIEARYRRNAHSERAAQRARIDARYQVERTRCGAFNGLRRDRCLVQAHATKGRALLEAAAPYEVRF